MPTERSFAVTPLGGIALEGRDDGAIVSLTLCARPGNDDTPRFEPLIRDIATALSDRLTTLELAVAPDVAGLHLDVLRAIASVPRLSFASYSEIARRAGRPRAVRFVASCVGKNPVPLLVPCHRVVPLSCGRNIHDAIRRPLLLGNFTPDRRLKADILRLEGYFDAKNSALINFLS